MMGSCPRAACKQAFLALHLCLSRSATSILMATCCGGKLWQYPALKRMDPSKMEDAILLRPWSNATTTLTIGSRPLFVFVEELLWQRVKSSWQNPVRGGVASDKSWHIRTNVVMHTFPNSVHACLFCFLALCRCKRTPPYEPREGFVHLEGTSHIRTNVVMHTFPMCLDIVMHLFSSFHG